MRRQVSPPDAQHKRKHKKTTEPTKQKTQGFQGEARPRAAGLNLRNVYTGGENLFAGPARLHPRNCRGAVNRVRPNVPAAIWTSRRRLQLSELILGGPL